MGQGGGPEERAVLGEEAHVGFCSLTIPRGRPSWPAWMGVQGRWPLCLAWPWWGPVGPDPRPISYLQALQRKTNDSLVSWASSCVHPQPCPLPLPVEGTLLFPRMPVL